MSTPRRPAQQQPQQYQQPPAPARSYSSHSRQPSPSGLGGASSYQDRSRPTATTGSGTLGISSGAMGQRAPSPSRIGGDNTTRFRRSPSPSGYSAAPVPPSYSPPRGALDSATELRDINRSGTGGGSFTSGYEKSAAAFGSTSPATPADSYQQPRGRAPAASLAPAAPVAAAATMQPGYGGQKNAGPWYKRPIRLGPLVCSTLTLAVVLLFVVYSVTVSVLYLTPAGRDLITVGGSSGGKGSASAGGGSGSSGDPADKTPGSGATSQYANGLGPVGLVADPINPQIPGKATPPYISVWPRPRRIDLKPTAGRNVAMPLPISVVLVSPGGGTPTVTFKKAVERGLPNMFPCSAIKSISVTNAGSVPPADGKGTTLILSVASASEGLALDTSEWYSLAITGDTTAMRIETRAATVFGVIRAIETIAQLVVPADPDNTLVAQAMMGMLPMAFRDPTQTSMDVFEPAKSCVDAGYKMQAVPLSITDWPRFPHRGFMLDTSRHYFPIPQLKRLIDGMAATKLNVFHWHIVDATSFPFQFKEAPEMASKGAYSAREVYTEEMIIDFVEYCRLRGIRVMPEYDMPGHTTAWARSYPDATMCVGSRAGKSGFAVEPFSGHLNPYAPATYDVVGKILQASNRLFPDAYIHMGHDEINPKCWATLPRNGQDIKQVLKDFHAGLRPLVPKNKRVMLWQDPFLTYQMENEKQPDGGFFQAVAIWGTGTKAGDQAAIRQIRAAGKQVLLGDYTAWYLDCGMGAFVTDSPPTRNGWCTFSSWQNMYYNTVFPADSGTPESASGEQVAQLTIANDAVLGAEVSLWSELIDGANLFTTSFPRTLGFAERVWSNTNVTTGGDPGTSGDTLDEVYDRIDYARTRLLTMRGINSQALQPTWCRGRTGECRMDF